jgi:O-antigen/teichoic acid export membrane protein
MLAANLVLAALAPLLIPVDADLGVELRWGFVIAAFATVLVPLGPVRLLLEVEQRGYLINLFLFMQSLCTTGAALALAYSGAGLVGQFLAPVLGGLPLYASYFVCAWRRAALPHQARSTPQERARLKQLSLPMLLWTLGGRMSFQSDNILVSFLLGATAVVPFALTQRLLLVAQTYVLAVPQVSWAALAELQLRGELEQFNRRLLELTRYAGAFALIFLVPVAVLNERVVGVWVGPDRYAGHGVTLLTTVAMWVNAILVLWGWPLISCGLVRQAVPAMLLGAAVTVGAGALGTHLWGLIGPPIGTLLGMAAGIAWTFPLMLRRHCRTPLLPLCGAALRPLVVAILYAAALIVFVELALPPESGRTRLGQLAVIAAAAAAAASGGAVLSWWFILPRHNRADWLAKVRAWLARPTDADPTSAATAHVVEV